MAKQLKARVFNISPNVWNAMTQAQRWAANQKFLQESIRKGHDFVMSTNAYNAKSGTYLYLEIQYLLNSGYKIVNEGWRMVKKCFFSKNRKKVKRTYAPTFNKHSLSNGFF